MGGPIGSGESGQQWPIQQLAGNECGLEMVQEAHEAGQWSGRGCICCGVREGEAGRGVGTGCEGELLGERGRGGVAVGEGDQGKVGGGQDGGKVVLDAVVFAWGDGNR